MRGSRARFQSTHPLRGATFRPMVLLASSIYFNPRTPCGVRRVATVSQEIQDGISIHAPLAGCDVAIRLTKDVMLEFQSTHPLRGATLVPCPRFRTEKFQSTHPLRGATSRRTGRANIIVISIHAPLAGCDYRRSGRAQRQDISIHAPLAGCDRERTKAVVQELHFNPRTPCGVRQQKRTKKTALFLN